MNSKILIFFVLISLICFATCLSHHSRTEISRQFSKVPFLFSDSKNSSEGSRLYCLGGKNDNGKELFSVSVLNPILNEWKSFTEMSTPKAYFGASAIGKKIYVSGGHTGNEGLKLMEVFDIENNSWSVLAPMPNVRHYLGMTVLNEDIYVSGGRNGYSILSSVLKYSTRTNTWTNVKAMNGSRSAHELVTLNGAIYAISGWETKTVERYSPAIDKWSFVASTKYEHYYFGATSHQNKIYVLSAFGFEVFHPDSNIWQELPFLFNGFGTQLVSINEKLLAVGVWDRYVKKHNAVYEFDTINNLWIRLPDMDVGRSYLRAVVVNS